MPTVSSDPEHFDQTAPQSSQHFILPAAPSVGRKPLSSNQATMSGTSLTSSAVPLLTPSLLYRDLHNDGVNRQLSVINFSAGFRFLPAATPAPLYQLQFRTPLPTHSYPQQQQSDRTYPYQSDWTHQRQNYPASGHPQFTPRLYQTLAPQSGLRPRQQLRSCPIHDLQVHQDAQHLHNFQQRSPPRHNTETRSNADPRASNRTISGDASSELNVERAEQESTNSHTVIPGLQDEGGIIAGGFEALSSLVAGSVVDSSSLTTMLATMQTFQREANRQTHHCERLVADICLLEDKIKAYIKRNPDRARTPERRDVDENSMLVTTKNFLCCPQLYSPGRRSLRRKVVMQSQPQQHMKKQNFGRFLKLHRVQKQTWIVSLCTRMCCHRCRRHRVDRTQHWQINLRPLPRHHRSLILSEHMWTMC